MPEPDVPNRILDAVIEAASIHGVTRMSVSDVAKRAGLSRPTLYKYFPSKEALVAAATLREAIALIDAVVAAADAHDEPRAALEAGVGAALRLTREHPLLDRVIRTEPETLVPFLVSDGGPVMSMGRGAVEDLIRRKVPGIDDLVLRRLADILVRLLVSYALSAPDDPPEVVAAAIAAFLTVGALDAPDAIPSLHVPTEDR